MQIMSMVLSNGFVSKQRLNDEAAQIVFRYPLVAH